MIVEELHFSRLKLMGQSPAHFQAYVAPETAALRNGRGVHSLLLGGSPVICYPDIRRGKKWEAFEAEHSAHIILNEAEHERVAGMVRSVMQHAFARELLAGCGFELELEWRIGERTCAGRLDALKGDALVELKSTRCSKPSFFEHEVVRRGYAAQLAWYRNGVVQSLGFDPMNHWIIAVESAPPFPTTCFRLSDELMVMGEKTWIAWLEQLGVCEASNHWPGYVADSRFAVLQPPDEWGFSGDEEAA